jgi:hypothetical protein
MCETVPDSREKLLKNRFAWVIHGNGVQILNRESLGPITNKQIQKSEP